MTHLLRISSLITLFITVFITGHAIAEEKPNIVLIVMDNLGWGEVGVYGGGILRGAETPRIDELASEGLRLLNFNVESQCVPSRSALMTGRHPIRSGTSKVVWGMLYGMTQWERTMPEILGDAGYATAMYGKWHLGDIPGRFPTDQGFDEWYGVPNTTDESLYQDGFKYKPEYVDLPHFSAQWTHRRHARDRRYGRGRGDGRGLPRCRLDRHHHGGWIRELVDHQRAAR